MADVDTGVAGYIPATLVSYWGLQVNVMLISN